MEKLAGDANRSLVVVFSQSNIYIYIWSEVLCANDGVLVCDLQTVGKSQVTETVQVIQLHMRAETAKHQEGYQSPQPCTKTIN